MTHRLSTCIVAVALAAASATLDAHHGAAAYNLDQATTLSATVKAFAWASPHALIEFDAADGKGPVGSWTAETAGLVILVRAGWTKTAITPGDRITIVGHRARNGSHTMLLQKVVLADGRELNNFVPR